MGGGETPSSLSGVWQQVECRMSGGGLGQATVDATASGSSIRSKRLAVLCACMRACAYSCTLVRGCMRVLVRVRGRKTKRETMRFTNMQRVFFTETCFCFLE